MNIFDEKLAANRLTLKRGSLRALQINVGRKCNQTCRHCHVDAAPWRTEMMGTEVARRVGEWIQTHRPAVVDLTGGAPELSEHFRYFVEITRDCGCHVIDRIDCDFNQMLRMQIRNGKPLYLWDVTPASLEGWEIQTGVHCLACTAGCGSSCTGAVAVAQGR
jgi:hypothetical protein